MRWFSAKPLFALLAVCACANSSNQIAPPQSTSVVTVALSTTSVPVGRTIQAAATLLDAGGNPVDDAATWSTSNGNASVTASGLVTALSAGSVDIIAASRNGVHGKKPLVVQPPTDTTVSTPPAPPVPPAPSSGGLLASHNFDDGTLGPYKYGSVAADMDIIPDPTNSGRGKVLRFHYAGVQQDRNRGITYEVDTHLGDSLFFKGDYFIPATASTDGSHIARKLLYWQSANWPTTPVFWSIIGMFGNGANNDNNYAKADGSGGDYASNPISRPGTITFGVWHTIETQVYLGSAPGASDGVFREWMDGVLVVNETHKKWTDAAWAPASAIKFTTYYVGDQVNGSDATPYDEYRYWDNVSFGRTRIR